MAGGTHISQDDCANMREDAREGYKQTAIADRYDTSPPTVRNHIYGHCSHDEWVDEPALDPPTRKVSIQGDGDEDDGPLSVDWLDCSAQVVVDGVNQSQSGQITRLYYESYGNPANDPGQHDKGPDVRRQINLRAVEVIPFTSDRVPTIVFEDDNEQQYYFTPFSRVCPDMSEVMDDKHILAVRDGDEMEPVGEYVAFAIPDHERMSPQLQRTASS